MKTNTKYTALEILTVAKIADAGAVFGKIRVRIAGIAGIVKPDHLIKIQPGTKEIEIIVGVDSYKLAFEEGEAEQAVSEGAKVALEVKGKESTKKAEAHAKAKVEVKAKAEAEAEAKKEPAKEPAK